MLEWLRTLLTVGSRLAVLETNLIRTNTRMETLETKFIEALAAIDEETNRIAADIEDLKAQITGQGIPEAKEAEILSLLEAQVARLRAVGKTDTPSGGAGSGSGSDNPAA